MGAWCGVRGGKVCGCVWVLEICVEGRGDKSRSSSRMKEGGRVCDREDGDAPMRETRHLSARVF
jgi:hypothetical protein